MPLQISPEQLTAIANRFGTPVYVYHAERIREQFETLRNAFRDSQVRFFYASKALTNINVLRYVRSIGCDVDCSSINEVRLAIHAGFPPERILYTSNSIAFSEIVEAREAGVHINIDSLSNLRKFAHRYGSSYPVGIRLRPNIMAGGNLKISTGHDKSKFGIPLEQMGEVLKLVEETGVHIRGLQIHTGSEIKDVEVFAQGIELLFDLALQFPALEFIDLGGGFKVPYRPGEEGTNMEKLGRKVAEEFDGFEKRTGRRLEVWFEPGKFLVSEAGYFLSTVTVLKPSLLTTFAGIDSGLNHLIRPMFYGSYHEIKNLSNPEGNPREYTVVGNICETDTFAEDRQLPEIREGDILCFYNAGAYGMEMASNYNSRFRPAEVLWLNQQAHLIRRRETLEDLLHNQLDVPGLTD